MFGQPCKKFLKILQVLSLIAAGNEYIVEVDKNRIQPGAHSVHKSLERLCCIFQAKWHSQKFPKAERGNYRGFGHVLWRDGNLMISSYEIDLGENLLSGQNSRKILNMRDRVTVRYSGVIEPAEIAAGALFAIALVDQVQWAGMLAV